ncbi:MAG: anti-sigma factor [Shinella sp.]|nr:anti-sigma factor [Shinella sp.]
MRDPRRDEVIAGEYVLGVLSVEDRRKVEARLLRDRSFAAMVHRWQANLCEVVQEDYVTPPPYISVRPATGMPPRDAVMICARPGGLWHSLAFWRVVAIASAAVATLFAMVAGGSLFFQRSGKLPLVSTLSGEGGGLALYDGESGKLKLTSMAAGTDPDKSLELWLSDDGKPPVSLGLLSPAGESTVLVPQRMRAKISAGDALSVTAEPLGGSPTGAATGQVIASGTITGF